MVFGVVYHPKMPIQEFPHGQKLTTDATLKQLIGKAYSNRGATTERQT